ncbi:MAG: hypothetical protein WC803_03370 [Sphingomonas sp.]
MKLLLFLSAFLSALAGVVSGGGQSLVPVALSRPVENTGAAGQSAVAVRALPVAAQPSPSRRVVSAAPLVFGIAPLWPLYASRRRE